MRISMDRFLIYRLRMELQLLVFTQEPRWLFQQLLEELQLHNFRNLPTAQAMDLDMTAMDKENKTSIITRLVMEPQGNLLVHKEAPAQGGQVKVTNTGVTLNLVPLNFGDNALQDYNWKTSAIYQSDRM